MAGGTGPGKRTDASTSPAEVVSRVREQVSGLAVELLTDRERVDLIAELERLKNTAAATQARATHALRCSREATAPQDAVRSVGAEVALACRESPTLGDRFVGTARALVDEMPVTMRALDAGECSERQAVAMVQSTAVLSLEDRAEVDRRVGPLLARLGLRGTERAARQVAAELDVAAVVRRMEGAVRSRRVTVRPAPDGMAYLTVLGPMVEVVGAAASLRARAQAVVSGQCPDESPDGRSAGAVAADTALRLTSGRAVGQAQPVEVQLVMTDRSLLGIGDPDRSTMEPARVPGSGPVPAPVARSWVRGPGARRRPLSVSTGPGPTAPDAASSRPAPSGTAPPGAVPPGGAVVPPGGAVVPPGGAVVPPGGAVVPPGGAGVAPPDDAAWVWLRRLYTSPDGRDLVAMDSRRRFFTGRLRQMLVLRDDVCTTPWCEAPIAHADHTTPAREGGATSYVHGTGKCARCNLGKEAPGWVTVARPVAGGGRDPGSSRHDVAITTPSGRRYSSEPPPLLGWGWTSREPARATVTDPTQATVTDPTQATTSAPTRAARGGPAGATVTDPTRATTSAPTRAARGGPDGATVTDPTQATIGDPASAAIADPAHATMGDAGDPSAEPGTTVPAAAPRRHRRSRRRRPRALARTRRQ